MYDIIQLNGKSQEDLVAIAKALQIKKADAMSREDLIYQILDEQAIQGANQPAPRRRNRIQRDGSPVPVFSTGEGPAKETKPVEAVPVAEKKSDETAAPVEKKRRGRPAKQKPVEGQQVTEQIPASAETKEEAVPAEGQSAEKPHQDRRRKKHAKPEHRPDEKTEIVQAEATQPAEVVETVETQASAVDAEATPATEAAKEGGAQPRKRNRKKKNRKN